MSHEVVPYACVYIDAVWSHFTRAAGFCVSTTSGYKRDELLEKVKAKFMTSQNRNGVLPCLSVRTALDLYLRVKNFPRGSEVLMSAVNIPDVTLILRHYGLRVVPVDVILETAAPNWGLLERLVTDKTVAILVAAIYGKTYDLTPCLDFAAARGLVVIDDRAEAFHGSRDVGDPRSDLTLFSFGVIKYCTAFGGGVAKVRDPEVLSAMEELYGSYPVQSHTEYLTKVLKYSLAYLILDTTCGTRGFMGLARAVNMDHKEIIVPMLRGFPKNMVARIRKQPCSALLRLLLERLEEKVSSGLEMARVKGEYMSVRLPEGVTRPGYKATKDYFWLYPIVVP